MEPKAIKKEVKRLEKLKKDAHDRWISAKSEHYEIGRKIYEVIDSCTVRVGKKHAGGGGGLGGSLWVVCKGCGHKHHWDPRDEAEVAEFRALPGKVTYHSTGN